ncbi:MAG: hypothetical protein QOE33_2324 [Acidobacteriota bacterium]|nr:hypothetical protein [Acidobacteriota bacterium]
MAGNDPNSTIQELLKQPREKRLKAFREFKVKHPLLKKAYDELRRAVRDSRPGSLIFIYGPAGVGKTTLLEGINRYVTEMMFGEMKKDPERIPVITLQLIAPTSGNFDWKDYFKRLLVELDEPLADHKIDIERWATTIQHTHLDKSQTGTRLILNDGSSTSNMRFASEQALRHRKPLVVLLDDAQHLGIIGSGRRLLDQLNTIKSIGDKSLITHCLCGTYELMPLRNLNGQLSRRSIDIHFGRYHARNKAHQETFKSVLNTFQQRLPLAEQPDLVSMWDFFYERSIGCIGVLKDWLTLSLAFALESNSRTITVEHLEHHAPSVAQCTTMLREAVDGEKELEEVAGTRALLRTTLGLEPELSRGAQEDYSIADSRQTNEKNATRRKHRVGARKPVRDKVGTVI